MMMSTAIFLIQCEAATLLFAMEIMLWHIRMVHQITAVGHQVEVDIEFFDPKEADFHGIKILVEDILGGVPFDASQLADAIIGQARS